mgnify:CR=1 FL=1
MLLLNRQIFHYTITTVLENVLMICINLSYKPSFKALPIGHVRISFSVRKIVPVIYNEMLPLSLHAGIKVTKKD